MYIKAQSSIVTTARKRKKGGVRFKSDVKKLTITAQGALDGTSTQDSSSCNRCNGSSLGCSIRVGGTQDGIACATSRIIQSIVAVVHNLIRIEHAQHRIAIPRVGGVHRRIVVVGIRIARAAGG